MTEEGNSCAPGPIPDAVQEARRPRTAGLPTSDGGAPGLSSAAGPARRPHPHAAGALWLCDVTALAGRENGCLGDVNGTPGRWEQGTAVRRLRRLESPLAKIKLCNKPLFLCPDVQDRVYCGLQGYDLQQT
ncbi:uncharacterized protein LOC116637050 isoform X2 [Phoca vitulina]|uniref:uncharacterized protein LOC116637050 isoform X2 n=1 Tax=Phoca vitulina TaxID=9720 RepID=UPI00139648C5|nr:uncharacterized protein LOC116637050 isoform X2 [Phoca vitulina]